MASGLNKVSLIGNLGKDPEVRFTQGGMAVCSFSVAVTERRKEGETWGDHTEWFNVVSFGKTAENVGKFLKKGRQTYVDGRLQTRKWQDREGKDRYTTEVVANQVLFLGNRENAGGESGFSRGSNDAGSGRDWGASQASTASVAQNMVDEDEIPF